MCVRVCCVCTHGWHGGGIKSPTLAAVGRSDFLARPATLPLKSGTVAVAFVRAVAAEDGSAGGGRRKSNDSGGVVGSSPIQLTSSCPLNSTVVRKDCCSQTKGPRRTIDLSIQ